MEYTKFSKKMHAKLDGIFEPTINIKIGTNEIDALYDVSAESPLFLFLKKRLILVHS
jgi:hypothetical protein